MSAQVGIDCGSAACKGVLVRDGRIIAKQIQPAGWNPQETARVVLHALLQEAGLAGRHVPTIATGYGRTIIKYADRAVTEITCHARGAEYMHPGVRTVIDIGGQDSKAIAVQGGKVSAFQMNDKCAAGTGRFLEMTSLRLGVPAVEFGALLKTGESCHINSTCAVFADSEVVSLLAAGVKREAIAGGIVDAIARRTAALAGKVSVTEPVLLTGGLAALKALQLRLEALLGCPVQTHPLSLYAGAIGAALIPNKGG
jgi:predicted CoA-substrate-specific enzyme activase